VGRFGSGAPAFNESAIFIIRGKGFSAAFPWKLVFLGNKIDKETAAKTFANFDKEYWLAAHTWKAAGPWSSSPTPPG
jgi:NosR/NirI family nitrous oxide reductase transcriptional regulator